MTARRLCQSDPLWATHVVGLSLVTRYADAACLLTVMAEAQRELGIDPAATPVTVQDRAIAKWRASGGRQSAMPFIALPLDEKRGREPGANAVTVEVGAANRLRIGSRLDVGTVGVAGIRDAIADALASKGRAAIHVDTNAADADHNGKHWTLVVRIVGDALIYADPATGEEAPLPTASLAGPSGWKSRRPFAVRGMRTVHRLA